MVGPLPPDFFFLFAIGIAVYGDEETGILM
jgi:hypothetical protein